MKHTAIIRERPKRSGKHSTPDGAICGNGDIGVILGEHKNGMTCHISKADFWLAGEDGQSDGGIKPVGMLNFDIPHRLYENYYVEQRMDEGEIFCRFSDVKDYAEFLIFVSHKTRCVWIKSEFSENIPFKLPEFIPADIKGESLEKDESDGVLFYKMKFSGDNLVFDTEMNVAVRNIDSDRGNLCVISLDSSFDKKSDLSRIKEYNGETYDRERNDNRVWWKKFYEKSSFNSSDEILEMNWYASQYLLAVCALNTDFPPGLYGNFITVNRVNWKGDYHLNYNYQGPFYGACSSNHTELTDCYTAPIFDMRERGRQFAERFLNQHGVFYPVGIGPKGMLTERCDDVWEKMFLGQRSNAIHSTDIMIMRWYATYDKEYAQKIYPFFLDVAAFWEGYLVNRDGIYNVVGDAVHEIPYYKDGFDPKEYDEKIHEENNLLSLGLLRMFFKCLIDISRELDCDSERRENWQDIVDNLHEFPTFEKNGKEVFRYTSKGTDWNDSNGLCIQHIYPCGQIGLSSDSKVLEISRNTFFTNDRWDDGNAGCSIFPCSARIGLDPKLIIKRMKQNFDKFQLPNMLFLHGGGCLENSSIACTTLNEMVLQSYEGIIRFFPVWDRDIDCSFRDLRADGAFLVSASIKDGKIDGIKILSEKGRKIRIENPFERAEVSAGGNTFVTDERVIESQTGVGSVIYIKEK